MSLVLVVDNGKACWLVVVVVIVLPLNNHSLLLLPAIGVRAPPPPPPHPPPSTENLCNNPKRLAKVKTEMCHFLLRVVEQRIVLTARAMSSNGNALFQTNMNQHELLPDILIILCVSIY